MGWALPALFWFLLLLLSLDCSHGLLFNFLFPRCYCWAGVAAVSCFHLCWDGWDALAFPCLSLGLGLVVVVLLAFYLYSFLSFIYFEGLPPLPGKKKEKKRKWWIALPSRPLVCLWWRNIVVTPQPLWWSFVLITCLPLLGICGKVRMLGLELLRWLPLWFC